MEQKQASKAAIKILIHLNQKILQSTPTTVPRYCITAKPYLRAIADDNYGWEDPVMCVLYALNNLTQWRGEVARDLKRVLKDSIADQVARPRNAT